MASSQVKTLYQNGATAGAQLYTCPANTTNYLHKSRLVAGSSADATAQVYDNTSASGTPLAVLTAPAKWPDESDHLGGLSFSKGLYVVVTGTGAALHITYE